jgi:hypothetical protein
MKYFDSWTKKAGVKAGDDVLQLAEEALTRDTSRFAQSNPSQADVSLILYRHYQTVPTG